MPILSGMSRELISDERFGQSSSVISPSSAELDARQNRDDLGAINATAQFPQSSSKFVSGRTNRKRAKYVAKACSECKRRKVKCNGQIRCKRCTKMNLVCQYGQDYPRHSDWQRRHSELRNPHDFPARQNQSTRNPIVLPTPYNHESTGSTVIDSNNNSPSILSAGPESLDLNQPRSVPPRLQTSASPINLPPMAPFSHPPHRLSNMSESTSEPRLSTRRDSRHRNSMIPSPSPQSATSAYTTLSLSPERTPTNSSLPKPSRGWGSIDQGFNGPTSSSFPFQQATNMINSKEQQILNDMRRQDSEDCEEISSDSEASYSDGSEAGKLASSLHSRTNKKFLYIDYADAKKLIEVYECEVNCMYPIFEVNELDTKYEEFRRYYEVHRVEYPNVQEISIIKIILAIATGITETHTREGRKLYQEVLKMTERRIVAGTADLYTLMSTYLIHNYQFHTDLESLAYRTICFAAVLAIELGLHQSSKLEIMFPDHKKRERCRALFWCIYVVDRRMSFSTGRPYIIRDEDVDQPLPQILPAVEISDDARVRTLYLRAMIEYSQVAGRVWRMVAAFKSPHQFAINTDEIDYIEFLIGRWQKSLPTELRLSTTGAIPGERAPPQLSRKLQTILYLRSNLMFLHLYRPVLFSKRTIADHMAYALRAVQIALDSIRELSRLQFETDLYVSCQIHYNYFLVSALGVLFVAIIHAPSVFAATCKREFNMALDLIKLFSKVSRVGKRLWATVKKLRTVTSAYGLPTRPTLTKGVVSHDASRPNVHRPGDAISASNDLGASVRVESEDVGYSSFSVPISQGHMSSSGTPVTADGLGFSGYQQQAEETEVGSSENLSPSGGSVSSLDGFILSTEISELFNLMAGNSLSDGVTESCNAPDTFEDTSTSRPSAEAPSRATLDNQNNVIEQDQQVQHLSERQPQSTNMCTPLGIELPDVAEVWGQNLVRDSPWDDELFRVIENMF